MEILFSISIVICPFYFQFVNAFFFFFYPVFLLPLFLQTIPLLIFSLNFTSKLSFSFSFLLFFHYLFPIVFLFPSYYDFTLFHSLVIHHFISYLVMTSRLRFSINFFFLSLAFILYFLPFFFITFLHSFRSIQLLLFNTTLPPSTPSLSPDYLFHSTFFVFLYTILFLLSYFSILFCFASILQRYLAEIFSIGRRNEAVDKILL